MRTNRCEMEARTVRMIIPRCVLLVTFSSFTSIKRSSLCRPARAKYHMKCTCFWLKCKVITLTLPAGDSGITLRMMCLLSTCANSKPNVWPGSVFKRQKRNIDLPSTTSTAARDKGVRARFNDEVTLGATVDRWYGSRTGDTYPSEETETNDYQFIFLYERFMTL